MAGCGLVAVRHGMVRLLCPSEAVAHDAGYSHTADRADERAAYVPALLHHVKMELCYHVVDGVRDDRCVVSEEQAATMARKNT